MKSKVYVLGAGIVGVTTAWCLRQQGFDVVVLERRSQPAEGTSFANGGQITLSSAAPWANPETPRRVLQGQTGFYLLPGLSYSQLLWGLKFLWNCQPRLARRNLQNLVNLCARSHALYQQLLEEQDIDVELHKGILHLYASQDEWQESQRSYQGWAAPLLPYCRPVDRQEILSIEPELASVADRIAGGFYAENDLTGDARQFTQSLANLCAQQGVDFIFDTTVQSLHTRPTQVVMDTTAGRYSGDHTVCCLGVDAPDLLHPVLTRSSIHPVKGYSVTFALEGDEANAPKVSFLDESHKIVATRLGNFFRVAGIAEVGDSDAFIYPQQVAVLFDWVKQYFPALRYSESKVWAGLRPMTPHGLPYVGATAEPRLWLNCGHGSLGWTSAMGTAEKLACDILAAH